MPPSGVQRDASLKRNLRALPWDELFGDQPCRVLKNCNSGGETSPDDFKIAAFLHLFTNTNGECNNQILSSPSTSSHSHIHCIQMQKQTLCTKLKITLPNTSKDSLINFVYLVLSICTQQEIKKLFLIKPQPSTVSTQLLRVQSLVITVRLPGFITIVPVKRSKPVLMNSICTITEDIARKRGVKRYTVVSHTKYCCLFSRKSIEKSDTIYCLKLVLTFSIFEKSVHSMHIYVFTPQYSPPWMFPLLLLRIMVNIQKKINKKFTKKTI